MKKAQTIIIGGVIIGILATIITVTFGAEDATTNAVEHPDKAIQIGKWIDDGSESYKVAKAEREEYEAKANEAANRMTKAALSNSGLRMTLCTDFRLKRDSGSFVALADDVDCASVASFR